MEPVCPLRELTVMYEDNESVKIITESNSVTLRTKYIDVRYHAMREEIGRGTVSIEMVKTENQTANVLTKNLGPATFEKHRDVGFKKM